MKLLIFTFSPVQGFISTARKLRDLFTGSYILSYLAEQVVKGLKQNGNVEVIYPRISEDFEDLANYPNRVVAIIRDDKDAEGIIIKDHPVASQAESKFRHTWKEIYTCVLINSELDRNLDGQVKKQFKNQVENYFNVFSVCVPLISRERWQEFLRLNENLDAEYYGYTYDLAERILGGKKSWRPYRSQIDDSICEVKKNGEIKRIFPNGCTMCGERMHLSIDWDRDKLRDIFKEEDLRHLRKGERLCAVCLIKRFAVKYYFKEKEILKEDFWHYPSTEEIAGLKFKLALAKKLEDDPNKNEIIKDVNELMEELEGTPYRLKKKLVDGENYLGLDAELFRKDGWEGLFKDMEYMLGKSRTEKVRKKIEVIVKKLRDRYKLEHKNPYYALLISDGDSIGEWLGIKTTIRRDKLSEEFHKTFSQKLSEYAKDVYSLWKDEYPRLMVYAGGDDVMALMHPFDVVEYAYKIAEKFEEKLKELSVSAGVLITHAKMSLQKALREVRKLEKEAKNVEGKGALCLGIMPRTGSLTYFVSKWEDLGLFKKLFRLVGQKEIGSGIAYELRLLKEKFGEADEDFNEDVFLSLLRRSVRRKVEDKANRSELIELMEDFYEKSKEYKSKNKKLFALNNFINLLYVARFVGTMREVRFDESV